MNGSRLGPTDKWFNSSFLAHCCLWLVAVPLTNPPHRLQGFIYIPLQVLIEHLKDLTCKIFVVGGRAPVCWRVLVVFLCCCPVLYIWVCKRECMFRDDGRHHSLFVPGPNYAHERPCQHTPSFLYTYIYSLLGAKFVLFSSSFFLYDLSPLLFFSTRSSASHLIPYTINQLWRSRVLSLGAVELNETEGNNSPFLTRGGGCSRVALVGG